MEDAPLPPEDSQEMAAAKEKPKRKRRRGAYDEDFMHGWLRRLRGQEAASITGEQKRPRFLDRLRHSFRGVYEGLVTREPVEAGPKPEQPLQPVSGDETAPAASTPESSPGPEPNAKNIESAAKPVSFETETTESLEAGEVDLGAEPVETVLEIPHPEPKEAAQPKPEKAANSESETETLVKHDESLLPPAVPPPLTRNTYEQLLAQDPAQVHHEIVSHKDPGARAIAMLAGVGVIAERIGRRRADRRQDKEIKTVAKEVKNDKERITGLEYTSDNNRQRTANLEMWQHAFERRPPKLETPTQQSTAITLETLKQSEFKAAAATSIEKVSAAAGSAESKPPTIAEIERELPVVEKLLHSSEQTSQKPETVLEQVGEVVRKNLPLERLYERRHEIKDEAAGAHRVVAAATSTGSKNAAIVPPVPLPSLVPTASQASSSNQLQRDKAGSQTSYRKAMAGGFLGAAVVLAILAVIYILG